MAKNREFLMLAKTHRGKLTDVYKRHFMSEKLDGIRGFWDGGVSRGMLASDVPWANTTKDHIRVTPPVSTGLWSRYGKVLYAPDSFVDRLPVGLPLDGELFTQRRDWENASSAIKAHSGDWSAVSFRVFDSPPYPAVFGYGRINNPHWPDFQMDLDACMDLVRKSIPRYIPKYHPFVNIKAVVTPHENEVVQVHEQHRIETLKELEDFYQSVLDQGGEGVMIRPGTSHWEPKRSAYLVKLKPTEDAEAVVIGFAWGRETDRGSKLLGKMGSMLVRFGDIEFELSGFTDSERVMAKRSSTADDREPYDRAGQKVSLDWYNPQFPLGSSITFKYRELSAAGVPKEARYHRKYKNV